MLPRFVTTISAVSVLILVVAGRHPTTSALEQEQVGGPGPRCPNEPTRRSDGVFVHAENAVRIPLAGQTQSIPEYHDCQRLLMRDSTYGPLVGIWAREYLDSLTTQDYARPIPVAEIYNFFNDPYAPLGIGPGYNCLYMQRTGKTWIAFMLPQGRNRPICPPKLTVTPSTIRLEVKVQPNSRGKAPVAARWDMDPRKTIQYMGVWCPDGWCEIGDKGFTPSLVHEGTTIQDSVKGWYDEQNLAVVRNGQLRPSRIRGRTVPVPNLEKMTVDTFDCGACIGKGGWVKVATLYIEQDSANYYYNKLNLKDRNVPNELFLRYSSANNTWSAVIRNHVRTLARKTIRIDHRNVRVPGTSRWHFMGIDESAWVRCSFGCCDVLGL